MKDLNLGNYIPELAEKLNKVREKRRLVLKQERENDNDSEKKLKGLRFDYRANISNNLARELYKSLGADIIEDAFEISAPTDAELMRCKYCIKFELGLCPNEKASKRMSEPLFLENNGKRYRLGFDCKNCEMVIFG